MTTPSTTVGLSQSQIVEGLRQAGVQSGDVVLVHSAMRTFGPIRGGSATVVSAFLEVLGPTGTLVVPTFTSVAQPESEMIIDPQNDRSQMGAISEAVRTHPQARRSIAYRHSFAAIGRRASVITEVDPALAAFDLRSSFGVMLALNTKIVLCGVTYTSNTSHHFAEWVCDVPYRHPAPKQAKVRGSDGRIANQAMTDYAANYGDRRPDFNRLGRLLEERGAVTAVGIGNAAVRQFALRDLIDLAQAEAVRDIHIFRAEEGKPTWYSSPLEFGTTVLSPERLNAAGHANRYQWSVMDENKLKQD